MPDYVKLHTTITAIMQSLQKLSWRFNNMTRSFKYYVNLNVVLFLREGDAGEWIGMTQEDH